MNSKLISTLVISSIPAVAVALLFYFFLGHRRDYLGHYAAGYGGTLSAIAVVLATIPSTKFRQIGSLSILPCTILCIAAGTVSEATVFRLAKFDEIDYCNQNLGAVIAGLVALYLVRETKPSDFDLKWMIGIGTIFLMIGAYFALT